MLSYERELRDLGAPEGLILRERREVFPVQGEVRALAWGGVMVIATGAGLLVARHLERIGPVALTVAIAVMALACYAFGWFRRTLAGEYATLLGALLVSVDVAYAESQFRLLGGAWHRHFLLLAVLHAIAAYVFSSRSVLALAIAALVSWLGVERNVFDGSAETGWRALLACGAVAAWYAFDRRFGRAGHRFGPVFEHYAANLALAGGLLLAFDARWRFAGLLLTVVAAVAVTRLGFLRRSESFVIYAYAYAVIAVDVVVVALLDIDVLVTLYLVVSSIAAIAGLFALHARFRRNTA